MIESQEHSTVTVGSNRSFGLVFTAVFAVIGLWPILSSSPVRVWALAIAASFLVVSILTPGWLRGLNQLWFKFGILLGRIINPIVMFLIYVVSILPIGLILRLLKKDLLRLKLEPDQPSYWIERSPAGPEPESLKNQF